MTRTDYDVMLEKQGGGCAVCGVRPPEGKSLAVDHNHETGAVRGILCDKCNQAIGSFKDSPALLRKAAEYLEASG